METKEGMKLLGFLFGAALWLETEDAEVAESAEEHLTRLSERSKRLAELETQKEVDALFPIPTN